MKSKLLFAVVFCLPLFIIAQKNWSPEQCLKLKNITALVPSPDGSKVLYTVREAVMTDDRSEYVNQVWLCNADGSNHIQLTKGDKNSSSPQWSPDGKWISFTWPKINIRNTSPTTPTSRIAWPWSRPRCPSSASTTWTC